MAKRKKISQYAPCTEPQLEDIKGETKGQKWKYNKKGKKTDHFPIEAV